MSIRVALLRKITEMDPQLREVVLLLLEEMERQRAHLEQQVTKTEFNELKEVVAELAEALKQTQAEVRALAEAQKRTEQRVAELAEAQKRTEQKVAELAEALKQTQAEVRALVQRVDFLHERIENLSDTVGYTLENAAYKALPDILRERLGIQVEGRLSRRYVRVGNVDRQVNIFGYGYREGQRVLIVGEAKTRPSIREVDKFLRLVEGLKAQEGLPVVPVFVAHDYPPSVEAYIREKGILLVWSYDF